MASRTEQKQQARERRLAEERARAESARRRRRLQTIGGVVLAAIVVVVVAIVVSSGGSSPTNHAPSTSSAAKADAAAVKGELAGIPQANTRLGAPTAPVTITEYGDLQCPVCRDFAEGAESQLIQNEVRTGKAQLIYRSLCTATCNGGGTAEFAPQQAAALAAGQQGKGWDYILLFYKEQGQEGTGYVSDSYLNNLAAQVPGLNYSKWQSDRQSSALTAEVTGDQQQAQTRGYNSTPTVIVQGPKGQAQPIVGDTGYGALQSAIKSVS